MLPGQKIRVLSVIFFILTVFESSCIPTAQSDSSIDPSACRLSSVPEVYLSVGHGFDESLFCVTGTGTINALMIFVDFADQPAGNDTTESLYDFFFPNASIWYETSSLGKLSVNAQADTSRFHRMPSNASAYAWNRGITYEQHEAYIQDALAQYQNSTTTPLFPVDVLYIVATRNAPAITYSPTFMGQVKTRDGRSVAKKAVTVGYDAYAKWGFKLINHETGHVMCLADLYPATGAVGAYVGDFNIMGNINARSPDYFAWDKWRLGWIEDGQVECVTYQNSSAVTFKIYPLESQTKETKLAVLPRSATQAMIFEVRTGGGVDDQNFAQGVVVYIIDTTVETLQGPIRVLVDDPLNMEGENVLDVPSWHVQVAVIDKEGEGFVVAIKTGL